MRATYLREAGHAKFNLTGDDGHHNICICVQCPIERVPSNDKYRQENARRDAATDQTGCVEPGAGSCAGLARYLG